MNTIDLAKLLMEKMEWSHGDLARKCGISRQVLYRTVNKPIKTERREGFHLGIISVAFKQGFEAEALSVVLGRDGGNISSVLRAAIMYPDLKPSELEQLIKAEKATNMSPLPAEVIKSIIKRSRS